MATFSFPRAMSHTYHIQEMGKMKPDVDKMTVRIAVDVRRSLEQWAQANLSTMTAELNAAVRLRAAQEHRERAGSAAAQR
jgi:hypothetical protein